MEVMIVDSNVCNNREYTAVDLSSFANLRVFEVGDYSFVYVDEVKLIGLRQLEGVVIGKNSFVKSKDCCNREDTLGRDYHFHLKNCERLRELKIGSGSFCHYSVCEIENVDRLEGIEIGDLDISSANFLYASLELKSDSERRK